ncbi:relaxase/mobilization nuclease domain-containing protein [Halomonas sp. AOP35-4E-18]|uniref:relaxase/mobilization nuclease domain-containing protein n=1 Tax=Halomonas sp. AOP35-4E-18 TaxID=3457686 RepID=UPI004033C0B5
MILRYFPYGGKASAIQCRLTGNRGGFNAVEYVRGNKDGEGVDRKVLPVLMKGDSDLMVNILDEGKYANQYVSGALRFKERDLSDEFLHKIIEEHERMSLPGLEPHQYASLWYKHQDKDDLELHFIYSKEELTTGKKLAPYVVYKNGNDKNHKDYDFYKMDAWKNAINAEYDLADPNHPLNRQAISEADIRLPFQAKNTMEGINEEIERRINKGLIKDRASLLTELKQMEGVIEVSRITKKSVSVKVEGRKAPIRLKGMVYEEGFTAENFTSTALEKEAEAYDADREERAKRERRRAEGIHDYQAKHNKQYYKPNEGKVLQAELYALVDDKILSGEITRRRNIVELIKAQDKVVDVVDTHKHHISVYYENGARPFRMTGEPYQREGSIDNYLQTLLDDKEESDKKLEERKREEEEFYFSKSFGSLDFVRMNDTRWNEFAENFKNIDTLKEHLSLSNDIIDKQGDVDIKTKLQPDSDMTDFDLSIFRVYAEDPHFEIKKEDQKNNKEIENDRNNEADRERTERIIRELVKRQPKTSVRQYIKDTVDGVKEALGHFSRGYRRSIEGLRGVRRKIESNREQSKKVGQQIESNGAKSQRINSDFRQSIVNFERQVLMVQNKVAYYKPESDKIPDRKNTPSIK